MRGLFLILSAALLHITLCAQGHEEHGHEDSIPSEAEVRRQVEALFTYQHGEVWLGNGMAVLEVPAGHKFLDATQSLRVIHELWGNTAVDAVLGMLLPEGDSLLADDALAIVLQYEPVGRVSLSGADDLDPEVLLARIQERELDDNARLAEQGQEPAFTMGWPLPPVLDEARHTLHWGKHLQVGEGEEAGDLLIADARLLGRHGVLIANAVTSLDDADRVGKAFVDLLRALRFAPGQDYASFEEEIDLVSPWTLNGLLLGRLEEQRPEEPFWNGTRRTGALLIGSLLMLAWLWFRQRKASAGGSVVP
ncbi:MAG: DUF2167 domain-containing protein [Flavobacteriales bacterium]|nr:DUF2167 domain-containing protein [Flavobacteriales bacterium]